MIVGGVPYGSINGKAALFYGSPSGLNIAPNWAVTNDPAGSSFGYASAAGDVNGDGYADVLVGAPYYDSNGKTDVGRVYVYYGSASGLSATANWTAESDQAGANFGSLNTNIAGDFNKDGYGDAFISAHLANHRIRILSPCHYHSLVPK